MARSSSADHLFLLTSGLRWLCQRSRHCLPERPAICSPMTLQRTLAPHAMISSLSRLSSSLDQQFFFQAPIVIFFSSSTSSSRASAATRSGAGSHGDGSPDAGALPDSGQPPRSRMMQPWRNPAARGLGRTWTRRRPIRLRAHRERGGSLRIMNLHPRRHRHVARHASPAWAGGAGFSSTGQRGIGATAPDGGKYVTVT